MNRTRDWLVILAVVLAALGSWYLYKSWIHHGTGDHQTQTEPAAALNPLTIASMRQQHYQASALSTEQQLGDLGGYTARVIKFESDGLDEYAYWAQPDGIVPRGGWPAIVLVHGYIDPTQYQTVADAYTSWIAAWARAGFIVVQPDLRGNGQSQGSAVSGHWDPDYTYDVMNLIMSLRANSVVKAADIGVVGHSMGGEVALNAAVISRAVTASMYVNGVVGSMYDLFYHWPDSPDVNDQPASLIAAELTQLIQEHGTPKSDPRFWNQASAINYVEAIKGPAQIDADIQDTVVPLAFSQSLDLALQSAHKDVTMYTYPGDDHQLSSPANLTAFLDRSTAFWRAHL